MFDPVFLASQLSHEWESYVKPLPAKLVEAVDCYNAVNEAEFVEAAWPDTNALQADQVVSVLTAYASELAVAEKYRDAQVALRHALSSRLLRTAAEVAADMIAAMQKTFDANAKVFVESVKKIGDNGGYLSAADILADPEAAVAHNKAVRAQAVLLRAREFCSRVNDLPANVRTPWEPDLVLVEPTTFEQLKRD